MRLRRKQILNAFVAIAMLFALPARAAVVVPPAADADQMQRALETTPTPRAQPGETPAAPALAEPSVPKGADQLIFVLNEIILEGAEHYPAEALLAPYHDLIGKQVSLKQIYVISTDIANRYHADGYTFVTTCLPPQQIADGKVRIRVTEGFISRVLFDGIQENRLLGEAKQTILAMKPIHVPTLEENLLLMNDLPGLSVKGVLEPDAQAGQEGALLLRIHGERAHTVTANVSADNYGSRYAGPGQLTPQVDYSDMFTDYDKTTLRGLTSMPDDNSRYLSLHHSVMLDFRTSLGVTISASKNAPAYKLVEEEIRSDNRGLSIDIRRELIRTRAENLSATATLDMQNFNTDALGVNLYRDKIRALRLGGIYDVVDPWQGVNLLNLIISKGLDALGARPSGSLDLSRLQGRSDFTKVEITASHTQPLWDDISLYALTMDQYANSPLLASEQFGVGGPTIGRGYDVSEITGDRGLSATAELRYDGLRPFHDIATEPFVFYDIGKVWNLSRNGINPSIVSAGLGLRFQISQNITGGANIAWPLTHKPEAPLSGYPYGPRIGFSLSISY